MFIQMPNRSYKLNERARSQAETRQRIVEAAVQLHEELGPRATTVSAIADRAGVQRLTVYRHFPDDAAIFQACTSHWNERNPAPDRALWLEESDPLARARIAIGAFAAYYRRTRGMWTVAYRDGPSIEALKEPLRQYAHYIDECAGDIAEAFGADGAAHARIYETARMVLRFPVFDGLAGDGLDDEGVVDLAMAWLQGAAAGAAHRKALDLSSAPG
ncbi:MAG: TetR/AcrR family transcriptional regulator [Beijerinckiaceae bacterium]